MDLQEYKKILHGTILPESIPDEEQEILFRPFIDFINNAVPETLYKFRACTKNNISAFDQDEIWFASGNKMNDDFEAMLCFDKKKIKAELNSFLNSDLLFDGLQAFSQGAPPPINIQNTFPVEWITAAQEKIRGLDLSTLKKYLSEIKEAFEKEIDENDSLVHEIARNTFKFACFSDTISSPAMWGYYADSSQGFALSYNFQNGIFTECSPCDKKDNCPTRIQFTLAPVLYDDKLFDATGYATWLFQQRIIQKILNGVNFADLYERLRRIIPCPDYFMPTKILLHKSKDWQHEKEWRLIYQRGTMDYSQQAVCEHMRPSVLYLGQRISPIYEKILCRLATEKKIPVYKMQIDWNNTAYELHPILIQPV